MLNSSFLRSQRRLRDVFFVRCANRVSSSILLLTKGYYVRLCEKPSTCDGKLTNKFLSEAQVFVPVFPLQAFTFTHTYVYIIIIYIPIIKIVMHLNEAIKHILFHL